MKEVKAFLEDHQLEYEWHEHEAVHTVEQAKATRSAIKGLHCKNLFLRNQKGNRHFLAIFPADLPVDMKTLAPLLGIKRISFASAQRMEKYLKLSPGSVSVFGLLNDEQKAVELFVHKDILEADYVTFHPNDNRATVVLDAANFEKILTLLAYEVNVLHLN